MNSSVLGLLYHWAPSARRDDILKHGLQVYSEPCVQSDRSPYICLSPHPSQGWALSVDIVNGSREDDPVELFDLWQVDVPDGAEVHFRPFWGRRVEEIKVYTSIPADHIWYVGTRDDRLPFLSLPKKNKKKRKN